MSHIRKYCSPECRNAARRYRYRVAQTSEESPYRVVDPAGDPHALIEPTPCWRSADWHELARLVVTVMEKGWVLMPPPDEGQLGIDQAQVRDFMASQRFDPAPGDASADRELSLREQEDSVGPEVASDSAPLLDSAPPMYPSVETTQRPARPRRAGRCQRFRGRPLGEDVGGGAVVGRRPPIGRQTK